MAVTLNPDAEMVRVVREGLARTGGYCPCRRERTEATKCICEECDKNIDTATHATDADEATEAIRKLGEALTLGNTYDPQVIETVNGIITEAAERADHRVCLRGWGTH